MGTGASKGHPTQFERPASTHATREGERSEVHAITQDDVADAVRQEADKESQPESPMSESPISESPNADIKIKYFTKLFNATSKTERKQNNGSYTDEFCHHLSQIEFSYHAFDEFGVETAREYKAKAGKILVSSGSVQVLCDTVVDLLQSGVDGQEDLLAEVSVTLLNYTDHVPEVTHAVRDHGRLVPALLDKLKQWTEKEMQDGFNEHMCQSFLGIPHNLALRDENVAYLRQVHISDVFMLYLQTKSEQLKLIALTTLADIVTDEEAERLATTPELTQFLLANMRKALRQPNHRHAGWRLTELLRAVAHLARNDANKLLLVKKGALPLLLEGIKCQLQEERDGSMEALWALSLHKDNAKSYLNNHELLDLVVAVYQGKSQPGDSTSQSGQGKSQSDVMRRGAEGILWQLRHDLENTDKYKSIAHAFSRKSPQAIRTGHVMLSYQWDHQPLVKKLHDLLEQNGFKVWMDIHKMGCSTRQSMAEAVENASVVLCCMSPKYKDSLPCRQEAEYAGDLQKQILPLKMELNYKPDGWLGLMIAGKIFYDFSGKYHFDRKFQELLKAIRDAGNGVIVGGDVNKSGDVMRQDVVDGVMSEQPVVVEEMMAVVRSGQSYGMAYSAPTPHRSAVCDVDKIRHWSRDDVQNWMNKFGLSGRKLDALTGEKVAFLHRLRSEAPEFFYNLLKNDPQLKTLPHLLLITKALDDLPTV